MVIDGKRKWFRDRKYCLDCSPYLSHNTKRIHIPKKDRKSREISGSCRFCGKDCRGRSRRCGACISKIRRTATKMAAVKIMGGSCTRCSSVVPLAALDFHHVGGKDFTVGTSASRSWSAIAAEIKKCRLLCANCHRIEHGNVITNADMLTAVDAIYSRLVKQGLDGSGLVTEQR
jgi:hypothetical protein